MHSASACSNPKVLEVVRRYWGFDSLRALQGEAIAAALAGRDSLVVLPTGGGKSLCYQVPPMVSQQTDVVISPLISLMKDQVDGLTDVNYPAAALHSGLSDAERESIESGLAAGKFRLLMVAPERLFKFGFLQQLASLNVRRFVIDEAHCISHWGHDFRPEYRQLAILRERFPKASLHAFTATATERVRSDILQQLQLRNPSVLVGRFDRANLVYRVVPMMDRLEQTLEVLKRHAGEAAIVYCLSRKETEVMTGFLKDAGLRVAYYHAGMDARNRQKTQEAFSQERLDVVIATVAFGMGIDRSNVRCVIHANLPKSIEHYQQETGRAGRDGLEAECVLLYTAADVIRWKSLMEKSLEEAEEPEEVLAAGLQHLHDIQRFANSAACRHKFLSEYFGQPYENNNCEACDICLGEFESVEDAVVIAQKILSCVARVEQRFGIGHVADVLTGANTEMIRRCHHDKLSTYALLKEHAKKEIQGWIYQLIDQGVLARTDGDWPVLQLNDRSWAVMRGQLAAHLVRPQKGRRKRTKFDEQSWEGADRGLFDALRAWRRDAATRRGIAPFMILPDSVLQQLSIVRPTNLSTLAKVRGIGEQRLANIGPDLLCLIGDYCREHSLDQNVGTPETHQPAPPKGPSGRSAAKEMAFRMFAKGQGVDQVSQALCRSRNTTYKYLSEYVAAECPQNIDLWVDQVTYSRVAQAVANREDGHLKPVFDKLLGEVPYETIRLVVAHLQALAPSAPAKLPAQPQSASDAGD